MNAVPVEVLLVALAGAIVLAVHAQARAQRARDELARLFASGADARTRLLPAAAMSLRLQPELRWAHLEQVPVSIVVFEVRGGAVAAAAGALREAMRAHEYAFELAPGRFLVALWDTDGRGAHQAVARLGAPLLAAGVRVVEAGSATRAASGDGTPADDVDALLASAARRMRPVEAYGDATAQTAAGSVAVLRATVPGIAWAIGALLVCYLVTPLLLPTAHAHGIDAWYRLALGLVAGAAMAGMAVCSASAIGAQLVPARAPRRRGVALSIVAGAACFGLSGAWALGAGATSTVAAQVGFDVLLVLAIVAAAPLARARASSCIALALACAAMLVLVRDAAPLAANMLRIGAAWGLGAALARGVERLAWLALVGVVVSAIDVWSVFSPSGVTHQLTRARGGTQADLLSAVLLRAPTAHGAPLFVLGSTDLVFMALFMASAWYWRLPVVKTGVALLAGLLAAIAASAATDGGVPVLPFLSAGFLLAHARVVRAELAGLR